MAATDMERLERVESKIDRLEPRFDRLEAGVERLTGRIDGLATKMDFEAIRDDIRRFTESTGAAIERLDRQFAESQAQTAMRFADHELVLSDHNRRITALKPPRS